MAKKNSRKPGGAAGIAVIDETNDDLRHQANGDRSDSEVTATKPSRKTKAKPEQQSAGNFGVSDIKKAAAFANSIGGLDKAIAVLQILKVAKEVQ
jgi:hypothetical protein